MSNNCKICNQPIINVTLTVERMVTETDSIKETYHEQCYIEDMIKQLNGGNK